MSTKEQEIAKIQKDWDENPRWKGIKRGYTAEDVYRLRGSFPVEYTLARRGASTPERGVGPHRPDTGTSTGPSSA